MSNEPQGEPRAEPQRGRVLLTGASGFVGGHILRALVRRGWHVACPVRSRAKLLARVSGVPDSSFTPYAGDIFSDALPSAAGEATACIHLVGIILERALRGQTFERVHVEGTRRVLAVASQAGIRRFVHMSTLGTRANAVSRAHQTKFAAEELVRSSGLDFTIFRPSVIHGPDGEFVRDLLVRMLRRPLPPFLPYFGDGRKHLQPVFVEDVARVFAEALDRPETIGQTYALGGAEALDWVELWRFVQMTVPAAHRWKPAVGLPVWVAEAIGRLGDGVDRRLGWRLGIPFNTAQVQMSQEDNTCSVEAAEQAFGQHFRGFRESFAGYASGL